MIKYDVKLNNGVEAFGTSGNQGNNPNPGSGDDGMH